MDALRALSSPSASVIRDGKVQVISKYVSHLLHYRPVSTSQYHNLMIKLALAIIPNLLIDTC